MKGIEYLPSVRGVRSAALLGAEISLRGVAWTDRLNENVIYPSNDFHAAKGVLVAAMSPAGPTGHPQKFAALSHDERFRISRESIEALHRGGRSF